MRGQKENPHDMQCKDMFCIKSVVADEGTTRKDITSEMFNKEAGKVVKEFELGVVYVPANPPSPSPVPEGSEEGSSPRAHLHLSGASTYCKSENFQVSRSFDESKEKSSEVEYYRRSPF